MVLVSPSEPRMEQELGPPALPHVLTRGEINDPRRI